MKSKSYNNKLSKKKPIKKESSATTLTDRARQVIQDDPKTFEKIKNSLSKSREEQDKDEQVPEQKAEVCPCCVNDCKCCTHPSGTVGHKCSCRCHSS